jgi:hypothetical protein
VAGHAANARDPGCNFQTLIGLSTMFPQQTISYSEVVYLKLNYCRFGLHHTVMPDNPFNERPLNQLFVSLELDLWQLTLGKASVVLTWMSLQLAEHSKIQDTEL